MAGRLNGKRIAILATDGVEQVELTEPRKAVTDEGAETEIVSLSAGKLQAMNHDIEPADTFPVDRTAAEASATRSPTSSIARYDRTTASCGICSSRRPTGLADGLAQTSRYQAAMPGFAPGRACVLRVPRSVLPGRIRLAYEPAGV